MNTESVRPPTRGRNHPRTFGICIRLTRAWGIALLVAPGRVLLTLIGGAS